MDSVMDDSGLDMDMDPNTVPRRQPLPPMASPELCSPPSAGASRVVLPGVIVLLAIVLALGAAIGDAAQGGRRPRERQRAKPPAVKDWDKTSKSAFLDDAFTTLEGERPDFVATSSARLAGTNGGAVAASGESGGGFRWSGLISPDTLADEVKEMNAAASKAVASASDFKGGGYNDARKAFSAIALAFAVTADYDGDVRWKKDAEAARDLFARVGNNCKVGTQQSFDESKTRVADLEMLLQGNPIDANAGREEDVSWSQVAGRPPLMSRLEAADGIANAAVASQNDFNKQLEKLLHEVEIVAVIGEAIQRPDYEYHDDDTYRGYASQMRDAAVKARAAVQKSDYNAARAAVGELKKSCDACHGDYRS